MTRYTTVVLPVDPEDATSPTSSKPTVLDEVSETALELTAFVVRQARVAPRDTGTNAEVAASLAGRILGGGGNLGSLAAGFGRAGVRLATMGSDQSALTQTVVANAGAELDELTKAWSRARMPLCSSAKLKSYNAALEVAARLVSLQSDELEQAADELATDVVAQVRDRLKRYEEGLLELESFLEFLAPKSQELEALQTYLKQLQQRRKDVKNGKWPSKNAANFGRLELLVDESPKPIPELRIMEAMIAAIDLSIVDARRALENCGRSPTKTDVVAVIGNLETELQNRYEAACSAAMKRKRRIMYLSGVLIVLWLVAKFLK